MQRTCDFKLIPSVQYVGLKQEQIRRIRWRRALNDLRNSFGSVELALDVLPRQKVMQYHDATSDKMTVSD